MILIIFKVPFSQILKNPLIFLIRQLHHAESAHNAKTSHCAVTHNP